MTAALLAPPVEISPPAPEFPLYRLTVQQYHVLAQSGVLTEDDRVELLQGLLVDCAPGGLRHDATVSRLTRLLMPLLPPGWALRIQSAVTTADSEPEPDLAVVREHPDDYAVEHPGVGDMGLVIEVAETSLAKDRRKAGIYAAARVPVYWVVNLHQDRIEVSNQPSDGRYADQRSFSQRDIVPLTLDGVEVASWPVRELLASCG